MSCLQIMLQAQRPTQRMPFVRNDAKIVVQQRQMPNRFADRLRDVDGEIETPGGEQTRQLAAIERHTAERGLRRMRRKRSPRLVLAGA